MRHTKIVATLGPATSDEATLRRLIATGVNVVRLNFSHGSADEHRARAALLRRLASELGQPVGILGDLQGPKIRIGKFASGSVTLQAGASFVLDADPTPGNEHRVGLDYPELIHDVAPGDVLVLDDGKIRLRVIAKTATAITTEVEVGGTLSAHKGINKWGGGLSAPALTDKDRRDIALAAEIGVDFLAVSFVKSAEDVEEARRLLRQAGGRGRLIAKIERTEAIDQLEAIISASDGIMVARGDLAVEVGDAVVPALQKRMIALARQRNRLSITATQMLESMIASPVPTRAEVSDVANAVLDGTDAVMLSAETAAGRFPVEAVATMDRVCREAERSRGTSIDQELLGRVFARVDEAIAVSAVWSAWHLSAKAIVALTQSGTTALWMSRLFAGMPIYALTPDPATYGHLTLYRQVVPVAFSYAFDAPHRDVLARIEQLLLERGWARLGDIVAVTYGEPFGQPGGTNTLRLLTVGQSG